MALIIDVETTGFPQRGGLPYGQNPPHEKLQMYDSARVVQVSMMLCNQHFEQVELKDFIVKSDGFSIENAHFHGITNEISATKGTPFSEIAETLSTYLNQVSHIVAHNANFDLCILKSELYRLGMHSIISEISTKRILCTMKHTKMIVKARNNYGIKDPSLAELYSFVFKDKIENAHNSKYDVINLHNIVKSMYDSNHLNFNETMHFSPQAEPVIKTIKEKDDVVHSCVIPATIDFSKMKLTELHKQCKDKNIKGYSKLNKNALIDRLNMVATTI